MVASIDGYFQLLFKGYCGVTQGEPLSPTLFNVSLETVIRQRVMEVEPTKDVMERLGLFI